LDDEQGFVILLAWTSGERASKLVRSTEGSPIPE